MSDKKENWKAKALITEGKETKYFAILEYKDEIVKKPRLYGESDMDESVLAYSKAAAELNEASYEPSTMKEVQDRVERLFPDSDGEQEELNYENS